MHLELKNRVVRTLGVERTCRLMLANGEAGGSAPALCPIYPVFADLPAVKAAHTGKGRSRRNYHFSFQRSNINRDVLLGNIQAYSEELGFNAQRVTWPNGSWPHSGKVIVAEECTWCPAVQVPLGIKPLDPETGAPLTYDGIVTASPDFVLGAQGADCPTLFLADPDRRVVGIAHSGWKPTVRGVVAGTVAAMTALGADPANVRAYVSPGAGDRFYEFAWDDSLGPDARAVFTEAGREDLLVDPTIRHAMTPTDCHLVEKSTGRSVRGSHVSLKLCGLIGRELARAGVRVENISFSDHSTICTQYEDQSSFPASTYMYHSARRDLGKDPERPAFGSSLCTISLCP
ncbi:hypothetical protein S40288_10581 [Stachybotrys chartarum IBT 40288]|nr:hypothetical protein S40288_10581 [Stachybotrys chartarum IBT 40288]